MNRLKVMPSRLGRSPRMLLRAAALPLLLAAVFGGAGCAQYQHAYRATELPQEFWAPETENIQEIDLSRLGNFSINSQQIHPGDLLEVTIITDLTKYSAPATQVRVAENGIAKVPLLGDVALAGLELDEAEQAIAAAGVPRVFQRPPHVTVSMLRQRTNMVWVIGAVKDAGGYELPRNASSLLAALVEAGGLSEDADQHVEIRRPGQRGPGPGMMPPGQRLAGGNGVQWASYQTAQGNAATAPRIIDVNLAEAGTQGNAGHHLEDGDIVVVSKRSPKPISVVGLVREPGEFELPPSKDMCLLDALAKAGDRTMQIADKVVIRRQIPGRDEPVVIETSIREAMSNQAANVRLAPGDVVKVEETPATVVLDALKSFIRFGLSSTVPLF
ncbi:MAG: polysaccharide biosynthesis/export family protein [Pirellulales bacterium]|nr:polysaccharide biosynthesis/export family protein [Pirellulales bacterium]